MPMNIPSKTPVTDKIVCGYHEHGMGGGDDYEAVPVRFVRRIEEAGNALAAALEKCVAFGGDDCRQKAEARDLWSQLKEIQTEMGTYK